MINLVNVSVTLPILKPFYFQQFFFLQRPFDVKQYYVISQEIDLNEVKYNELSK